MGSDSSPPPATVPAGRDTEEGGSFVALYNFPRNVEVEMQSAAKGPCLGML